MSFLSFNAALVSFLQSISANGRTYPAYLVGQVPQDAAFPYITFDMGKGQAFSQLPLSATLWLYAPGSSKNKERADFLDAAAAAIPETGRRLEWAGGFCMLYRSSGDFLSLMTDPEDSAVIGGRVGYEVTFYDM